MSNRLLSGQKNLLQFYIMEPLGKSLGQTIADGLAQLNVGDPVIVVAFLGYPHQRSFTAWVEKVTSKQIVVDGGHYWKSSGEQAGAGTRRIFPNDEELVEWAILKKKAFLAVSSLERSVHDSSPQDLKDLLSVLEKHGYVESQENADSKQPATLMEALDKSGLLDT